MTKKLLAVALVAGLAVAAWLVLRERGDTTTTVSTTTTPATIPVKAYFYRGAGLVPVVVRVPKTEAVATAAVRALLAGPPAGFSTALPAGTTLVDVTVAGGMARGAFSQELANAPRTAQAQIVYTLTQFTSLESVTIDVGNAGPLALSDGAERKLLRPATRADYVDLTPDAQIFVETPKRDSTVSSPVDVSGTAMVFEATLALEVWAGGKLLETAPITASNGAPERGTFAKTLDLAPGSYKLVFYEPSAQDGSHLHTTTVEITVTS